MSNPPDDEIYQSTLMLVGKCVYEWNQLHESMGLLLSRIVAPNEPWSKPLLAMWNSLQSDRAQREMLLAASNATFPKKAERKTSPCPREDIAWLVNKTNHLSDDRNNIVHAPLTVLSQAEGKIVNKVVPNTFFDNPRASKLSQHDLEARLTWVTTTSRALTFYARRLDWGLASGLQSWPAKPQLTKAGQR